MLEYIGDIWSTVVFRVDHRTSFVKNSFSLSIQFGEAHTKWVRKNHPPRATLFKAFSFRKNSYNKNSCFGQMTSL